MNPAILAAVEGGGTKFLAAVAESRRDGAPVILDRLQVATTESPGETLGPIAAWLAERRADAIGIATFGPLDLETGDVGATPKPGWANTAVRDVLTTGLEQIPCGFDTDVNGAALAEWRWGSARGAGVALYLTVGTGIGGGAVVGGSPIHGLGHPEMGHITVPRHPDDDHPGTCPHHVDCLEGMASGPALGARAGRPADQLPADDPVWDLAVHYLAHGIADLSLVLSPEVVVLGGGVMQRTDLVGRVEESLSGVLDGYIAAPRLSLPRFGGEAGLFGAMALAEAVLD